jgi:hypothetical protein
MPPVLIHAPLSRRTDRRRQIIDVSTRDKSSALTRRIVVKYADLGSVDISRNQRRNGVRILLCLKPPCDDSVHCISFHASALHPPGTESRVFIEQGELGTQDNFSPI